MRYQEVLIKKPERGSCDENEVSAAKNDDTASGGVIGDFGDLEERSFVGFKSRLVERQMRKARGFILPGIRVQCHGDAEFPRPRGSSSSRESGK